MAVELIDVLRWRITSRIQTDKLRPHHKVRYKRGAIGIERALPIALAHHDPVLNCLRVAGELHEARHVAARRTIQSRHIEVAHQTARTAELDRQEKRTGRVHALSL